MKHIIFLIISFYSLLTFGQTTEEEIDKECARIDSMVQLNELSILEYPDLSWCGGFVTGYYKDSNLLLIKSIYNAEAGHISQDIYVKNNAIKFIYKTHTALWDEHSINFPEEGDSGDYKNMTYADTTRIIYNLNDVVMIKQSNSEIVTRNFETEFYKKLIEWFECMRNQLKEIEE